MLMGPHKSTETSYWGSHGSDDIHSALRSSPGMGGSAEYRTSTTQSKPENQTLILRYSFVIVAP